MSNRDRRSSRAVNYKDPVHPVELAKDGVVMANLLMQDILAQIDHFIHVKDLEKLIKPCAIRFSIEQSEKSIEDQFLRMDLKKDDHFLTQEQRYIEEPGPEVDLIKPIMTKQVESCNDFAPPAGDAFLNIDIMKPPKVKIITEEQERPKSVSKAKKSSNIKRKTIQNSSQKKTSQLSVADNHQSHSSKDNQVKDEVYQITKALKGTFQNMFQDGLTDVYIDQLRARIIRKEENEKLNNLSKNVEGNKNEKMIKIGKKDNEIKGVYTFDDQGEVMQVNNVKVEKLPKLQGQSAEIVDIYGYDLPEDPKMKDKKGRKPPTSSKELNTRGSSSTMNVLGSAKIKDSGKGVIEKNSQVMSEGNFNIKENMKAGAGITYIEGTSHVDRGPSYFQMVKSEMGEKQLYTMAEYQEKFATQSEYMHRGKQIMMNKRVKAQNYNQGVVSDVDVLTQSQNEDGFPMPPDLMSTQENQNDKALLLSQQGFQTLSVGSGHSKNQRSQIRVHSTNGHRDMILKNKMHSSGNYMAITRNQDTKTPNLVSGTINDEILPQIAVKKSFEAISGALPRRASTRQGGSSTIQTMGAGSSMHHKPPTAGNAGGRIIAAANMRMNPDQISSYLVDKNKNRKSQIELASSSNLNHRAMVQQKQSKPTHLLDGNTSDLPMFIKDQIKGRVSSQMGTRTKYQRLQQKNIFAKNNRDDLFSQNTQATNFTVERKSQSRPVI